MLRTNIPSDVSVRRGDGLRRLGLGAMLQATSACARENSSATAPGQTSDLADDARRCQSSRELRPQAGVEQARRQDDRGVDAHRRSSTRLISRTCASRSRITSSTSRRPRSTRCRSASSRAGKAASRSATGGRTCVDASTTSPSSARCTRPTTTTVPRWSSSPAGIFSTAAIRRSAPGFITGWDR